MKYDTVCWDSHRVYGTVTGERVVRNTGGAGRRRCSVSRSEKKKKERFYHEICMIKGSFVYEEKREALSVW